MNKNLKKKLSETTMVDVAQNKKFPIPYSGFSVKNKILLKAVLPLIRELYRKWPYKKEFPDFIEELLEEK